MHKSIRILLLAFCGVITQSAGAQRLDDLSDRPADIARVKANHYREAGLQVLPAFFTDSVLGPGDYVGLEDATVRGNINLRIHPGTTVMFEPGKRLIVEGKLAAFAKPSEPITLTNVPLEKRYFKVMNPDSLWGGIHVESGGAVYLERVTVSCAETGLTNSGMPDTLTVECVGMVNRVVEPFALSGIETSVDDPACLSLRYPKDTPKLPTVETVDESPERPERKRFGLRLGFSGLTAVGVGMATWGIYRYSHNLDLYNNSTDYTKHTREEVEGYERDAKSGRTVALVGGAVALLGGTGLVLTFTF